MLYLFLYRYARKIEKNPEKSKVYGDDAALRNKYRDPGSLETMLSQKTPEEYRKLRKASLAFGGFLVLMLVLFVLASFVSILSDLMLPILGILLLAGGLVASGIAGIPLGGRMKIIGNAAVGIAPGILLIMMAMSIKFIISNGGIMDTILYHTANAIMTTSPFLAILLVYALILLLRAVRRLLLRQGVSGHAAHRAACPDLVGIYAADLGARVQLRRRFFQHDLPDESGAADLPGADGGDLHQMDEMDDQAAAGVPGAGLRRFCSSASR